MLLVEDDREFATTLAELLVRRGFTVVYCESQSKADLGIERHTFQFAIIDLMLPPDFATSGLSVLQKVRKRFPNATIFLMSVKNSGHTEIVADAMEAGAAYFFDKNAPHFWEKLLDKIDATVTNMNKRIFISHGHNELAKLKLKDFLRDRLNETAIILSEQPSRGLTVVEKLEVASAQCSFAIILLTGDDVQQNGGIRARQNVIHEVGFFQGKYGRQRVLLICEKGVEIFSNISGIIRLEFQEGHIEEVFEPIRIELEAAGFLR
jgi:predicted nucleotide-binding protein